jgi:hypothetical protein
MYAALKKKQALFQVRQLQIFIADSTAFPYLTISKMLE